MSESLTLEQLKVEAQKRSYLVIRRDGEIAWRPLKNWRGEPASTAVYILIGNRVLVRNGLGTNEHWFTLA